MRDRSVIFFINKRIYRMINGKNHDMNNDDNNNDNNNYNKIKNIADSYPKINVLTFDLLQKINLSIPLYSNIKLNHRHNLDRFRHFLIDTAQKDAIHPRCILLRCDPYG